MRNGGCDKNHLPERTEVAHQVKEKHGKEQKNLSTTTKQQDKTSRVLFSHDNTHHVAAKPTVTHVNDDEKSIKSHQGISLKSWKEDSATSGGGTIDSLSHSISSSECEDEETAGTSSWLSPNKEQRVSDNERDSTTVFPCGEALTSQCWKCSVSLRLNNDQFCFYTMHMHPHLQVPICSVCCDEVAAFAPNNDDGCSGCALLEDEVDMLFLCDSCPKSFCYRCVAMAHGGGKVGASVADKLASDEEGEWLCPCCQPPTPLEQLQKKLEEPDQSDVGTSSKPRSIEQILQELDQVENEMAICDEKLHDENIQQQRKEIQDEIGTTVSATQLSEAVNEELEQWKDGWEKHHYRLCDHAASLQDELETLHQIDLAKCYEKCYGLNNGETNGVEPDPEWKQQADRELEKRVQQVAKDPSHESVYDIDIPKDVEDLNTLDPDDENTPSAWRQSFSRATKAQIERALQFENELLAQHNVSVDSVFDDKEDMKKIVEEEQATSIVGGTGVSRIRRDVQFLSNQVIRQRRKPGFSNARSKDQNDQDARQTQIVSPTNADTLAEKVQAEKPSPATVVLDSDETSVEELDTIWNSGVELCHSTDEILNDSLQRSVKTVSLSDPLAKVLKPHQIEGVKFIWRNSFSDLAFPVAPEDISSKIGGCILAHNMGLGKSLTVISLLHVLLNHPHLRSTSNVTRRKVPKGSIHCVLLVVPVNTLANWEREFVVWTGKLDPSIEVHNLGAISKDSRELVIMNWSVRGGVLLVSDRTFIRLIRPCPYHSETGSKPKPKNGYVPKKEVCPTCQAWCALQDPGPDAVFLDEAHLMVSNSKTETSKGLSAIVTKRRVALSGSPFMNNLFEYYRMVGWVRPGVLGHSEAGFDREYVEPIMRGLASDSSKELVRRSSIQSAKLTQILSPYMSRKDASVLRDSLPPMQQVILHIRPTKTQARLYRAYNKYKKECDCKSFFKEYNALRPVHNHPGCLLFGEPSSEIANTGTESASKNIASAERRDWTNEWWFRTATLWKKKVEQLKDIENGSKVVLLLHIVAYAEKLGDKVVVFSQCLRTLDYIEDVLGRSRWGDCVRSLKVAFPGLNLGGWKKGKDFLRIDGDINSAERGDLIEQFNEDVEGSARLFLISSKAGGIGINLQSANRVVLFDSHFNPTITLQALYRCYRFGQQKHVFAYRLLTEGTAEEKVYSRSVNKTGVSLRVIDGKSIGRSFTEKELEDLSSFDTWVQCNRCAKWRMLKKVDDEENLPDEWFCEMNEEDSHNNTCEASEKDQRWYNENFCLETNTDSSGVTTTPNITAVDTKSQEVRHDSLSKKRMTESDVILTHLLAMSDKNEYISKYYFHEALLEVVKEKDIDDALTARVEKRVLPTKTQKKVRKPMNRQETTMAPLQADQLVRVPFDPDEGHRVRNHAEATTRSSIESDTSPSKKAEAILSKKCKHQKTNKTASRFLDLTDTPSDTGSPVTLRENLNKRKRQETPPNYRIPRRKTFPPRLASGEKAEKERKEEKELKEKKEQKEEKDKNKEKERITEKVSKTEKERKKEQEHKREKRIRRKEKADKQEKGQEVIDLLSDSDENE